MKTGKKHTHKIIVFHLLNNFSGSPRILASSINSLKEYGYDIILYTSKSEGFLSDLAGIEYKTIYYKWSSNKIFVAFSFLVSQVQIFIDSLSYGKDRENIFYINTILPFGAALGAYLTRTPIIYHIHEYYIKPNIIQRYAWNIMNKTATYIIVVSNYLAHKIYRDTIYIPNTLSSNFYLTAEAQRKLSTKSNYYDVLMVTSLAKYKGIDIFIKLSTILKHLNFCLVIGSSSKEINKYFGSKAVPANVKVFSKQTDLHCFYGNSKILLNLSIPELCIETFGMTILEAMIYGLPIIAPPVGGPAELVKHGVNGYLIHPNMTEEIIVAINELLNNEKVYNEMSKASVEKAEEYNSHKHFDKLIDILDKLN